MQAQTDRQQPIQTLLKPIPSPRGTQTVPQPKPVTPRLPDGRFTPKFHPHPEPTTPIHQA